MELRSSHFRVRLRYANEELNYGLRNGLPWEYYDRRCLMLALVYYKKCEKEGKEPWN